MKWLDKKLEQLAERIGQIVAEKVMALLPIILASAFKAMQGNANQTVDQLTSNVRKTIEGFVPGLKIPTLAEVMEGQKK